MGKENSIKRTVFSKIESRRAGEALEHIGINGYFAALPHAIHQRLAEGLIHHGTLLLEELQLEVSELSGQVIRVDGLMLEDLVDDPVALDGGRFANLAGGHCASGIQLLGRPDA